MFVESVEDARLESLEDHAIGTLDLTVGARVSDRGPVNSDVVPVLQSHRGQINSGGVLVHHPDYNTLGVSLA